LPFPGITINNINAILLRVSQRLVAIFELFFIVKDEDKIKEEKQWVHLSALSIAFIMMKMREKPCKNKHISPIEVGSRYIVAG
jgi:hypothetical protein